ncbi:UNVERIFIED_CONTAM: hypothetical protein BEN50_15035 [Euhalothece sp. KZN 001]
MINLMTISNFTIETIGKGIGLIIGIIGLAKVLYEINNIYNHLVTTDKIVQNQLERLHDRIQSIDEDVKEAQFENREARARILDRLLVLEQRSYKQTWDKYVQQGLISEEQLKNIRRQEQKNYSAE